GIREYVQFRAGRRHQEAEPETTDLPANRGLRPFWKARSAVGNGFASVRLDYDRLATTLDLLPRSRSIRMLNEKASLILCFSKLCIRVKVGMSRASDGLESTMTACES